jgi:hypothetical protein
LPHRPSSLGLILVLLGSHDASVLGII